MTKRIVAALASLLLLFSLALPCLTPAYAETDITGNPGASGEAIVDQMREATGREAPQQTTDAPLVQIVSEDEKLAGCQIRTYKLISAAADVSGRSFDETTAIFAEGVNVSAVVPDHDASAPPTMLPILLDNSIVENHAKDDLDWEYLLSLAGYATSAQLPYTTLTIDADPAPLPGTGVYLFVMEGYEQIGIKNEHIRTPFFTDCVLPTGADEAQQVNEFEIRIKDYEGTDPLWLAKMVRGDEEPSKRATLTAVYQPDNVPDDVKAAAEAKELEQEQAVKKEVQGGGLAFSLLPIVLVIGGVLALNLVMKARKKKPSAKSARKGKSEKAKQEEKPATVPEETRDNDEPKPLAGSHEGD